MNKPTSERFEALSEVFYELDPDCDEYVETFNQIRALAEDGALEAAGLVAEICAFDPRLRDPQVAYKFYNIQKKSEGFSITFRNISEDASHYLGEVGDFRNEAQISEIVDELGFDLCKKLDAEAELWRELYSGS